MRIWLKLFPVFLPIRLLLFYWQNLLGAWSFVYAVILQEIILAIVSIKLSHIKYSIGFSISKFKTCSHMVLTLLYLKYLFLSHRRGIISLWANF